MAEAFTTSVRLFLENENRAGAANAYKELVSAIPGAALPPTEQLAVATALESQGECRVAAEALERLLETYGGMAESQVAMVRLAELSAERLGDRALARRLFARLVDEWPDSDWADHARRRLRDLE